MTTIATPFRVLCLHDEGSNALELKESLQKLGDRLYLKYGIDLVYINAPLVVTTAATTTKAKYHHDNDNDNDNDENDNEKNRANNDHQNKHNDDRGCRAWWETKKEEKMTQFSATSKFDPGEEDEEDDQDTIPSWDDTTPIEKMLPKTNNSKRSGNTKTSCNQHHPVGLDASFLMLRQVWRSTSYVGILGVGQGASIGALLTLWLQQQMNNSNSINNELMEDSFSITIKPLLPPLFAVWIQAHSNLFPDIQEPLLPPTDAARRFQYFHVCRDCCEKENSEQRMAEATLLHLQFGGEFYKSSPSPSSTTNNNEEDVNKNNKEQDSCWIPSTDEMNHIGRFLVAQKNRLSLFGATNNNNRKNNHDIESAALVALQQALAQTEEQASALFAQQVAAHPPKALMAVIQPSRVTGRQPQLTDRPPGGGAPCPSEFLLAPGDRRRSTKQQQRDGPSRVHPSQQQQQQQTT